MQEGDRVLIISQARKGTVVGSNPAGKTARIQPERGEDGNPSDAIVTDWDNLQLLDRHKCPECGHEWRD